jgi:hypothetical protein
VSFAHILRCDLSNRAKKYAQAQSLPHCLSYGASSVVCFEPFDNSLHGNFLPASYKAIATNPQWHRRLAKVHTSARRSLPRGGTRLWRELDSCTSSDALLMNVFCYPKLLTNVRVARTLGLQPGVVPHFGFPARVPLEINRCDRTEVDMRLGDLLVEAKLTEGDFQRAEKVKVVRYRDFLDVFEHDRLPQSETHYEGYQLIRNVLAAHASRCSFCVLLDVRRPDLLEAFYAVVKCVTPVDLRTACRVLTWQELAGVLPQKLQAFLAAKYGIESAVKPSCVGAPRSTRMSPPS